MFWLRNKKNGFHCTLLSGGLHFAQIIMTPIYYTVKPALSGHSKRRQKLVFKTHYHLMQVKSIAEVSKGSILSTFIKQPFVFKTFVLSIFLVEGSTVAQC